MFEPATDDLGNQIMFLNTRITAMEDWMPYIQTMKRRITELENKLVATKQTPDGFGDLDGNGPWY